MRCHVHYDLLAIIPQNSPQYIKPEAAVATYTWGKLPTTEGGWGLVKGKLRLKYINNIFGLLNEFGLIKIK